jgi:SAM-dependent methyltransferase
MHASVMAWVTQKIDQHDLSMVAALDVGSYDVNGSVRGLFRRQYTGIDARPGPGVDHVWNIEDGPFPGDWGVVVSTEMLEHTPRPWRAVKYMERSLATGGWLLLTCRGYDDRGSFAPHNEPADFWRYSTAGLSVLVSDMGLEVVEAIPDPEMPGVFLAARKENR